MKYSHSQALRSYNVLCTIMVNSEKPRLEYLAQIQSKWTIGITFYTMHALKKQFHSSYVCSMVSKKDIT